MPGPQLVLSAECLGFGNSEVLVAPILWIGLTGDWVGGSSTVQGCEHLSPHTASAVSTARRRLSPPQTSDVPLGKGFIFMAHQHFRAERLHF